MSVHARIALICYVGLPALCAGAQSYDLQFLGMRVSVEAIGRTVLAINDSGMVVGTYSKPHRVRRCFAWNLRCAAAS